MAGKKKCSFFSLNPEIFLVCHARHGVPGHFSRRIKDAFRHEKGYGHEV
jgi:hypothetical protein